MKRYRVVPRRYQRPDNGAVYRWFVALVETDGVEQVLGVKDNETEARELCREHQQQNGSLKC